MRKTKKRRRLKILLLAIFVAVAILLPIVLGVDPLSAAIGYLCITMIEKAWLEITRS